MIRCFDCESTKVCAIWDREKYLCKPCWNKREKAMREDMKNNKGYY